MMRAHPASESPARARSTPARSPVAGLVTNFVFLAILLVSAGRLDYGSAWAYAAVGVLMVVLMEVILRADMGLPEERAKPGPGAEGWDKLTSGRTGCSQGPRWISRAWGSLSRP